MAFSDLVSQFGLPIGMLLTVLVLGANRTWVWGRELTGAEKRLTDVSADYERRLLEQRAAHLEREQELAAATERWQQLFLSLVPELRGLTEAVKAQKGGER